MTALAELPVLDLSGNHDLATTATTATTVDAGTGPERAPAGEWDRSGVQFEEFVATRGPALVRLARLLVRDPHQGEDVVQDVLAKALVGWNRIGRVDDVDAYVRRMVVNACTSFWRRAARREHAREHERLPEQAQADGAAHHAERDHLLRLLRRLPSRQRAVLVLRHYEGFPDLEIADLLGCSPVTVRSNAHRGLAALRRMLEDGASDAAPAPPQFGSSARTAPDRVDLP